MMVDMMKLRCYDKLVRYSKIKSILRTESPVAADNIEGTGMGRENFAG